MSHEEYNRQQMKYWDESLGQVLELNLLAEYLDILALAGEEEAEADLLSFYYSTPCFMQY